MVSTERMIFGNGIGIVKDKGLRDAKNILIQNSEHWNSGETESTWVQCFFEKPSIVTKIQVAFRSVELIRIVGNRSNVEKEILCYQKTGIGSNANCSNKQIKTYNVNCEEDFDFIELQLQKGGNISLFWVCVYGKTVGFK
jgi:hypothetical protein